MESIAILCGLGAFFITWKTYHWFWSLTDLVHESGYSYFMKRAGTSVAVGLLSYVLLSPDFQSSAPTSTANQNDSINFNKSSETNTPVTESSTQQTQINAPNSLSREDADINIGSSDKGGDRVDSRDTPRDTKSDDLINQSVSPKD